MNSARNQGKQTLPKDVQDNIIQNIQQIFPEIHRDIIQNILIKENWDLEKGLRFLHATRKSFLIVKNNQNAKKKNKNVPNNPTVSKGGTSTKPTNNKPDLFKKGPNMKVMKSKPDGVDKGDWVMINNPPTEQNAPKLKKKVKKNTTQAIPNPTKDELIKTVQNESNSSTSIAKANKKARKTQLLQSYSIIKHFGDNTHRISAYIKEGIKVMVLLRGCSGSGKSTFANQILLKAGALNPRNHVFSTDNFFIRADGVYNFNKDLLQKAHEWNQNLVMQVACEGKNPIFIDNTNSCLWEMKAYASIAVQYGYVLETLEPPTPWFFNEDILVRKSSHSVSRETIRKMLDRYEANLTGEDIIKTLQLSYVPSMIPPQGSLTGIDSPISKKHSKMLNIPLNNFNIQNLITLKPNSSNPSKSNLYKGSEFTLNVNPIGAFESISLASASDVLQPLSQKPESCPAFVEGYQQESELSSKESSSDIPDSDPEEMVSSSSSSSEDEAYQEDLDDQICDNDNGLEYVMVEENNVVVFQKEHSEMEGIKTLGDFKNIKTKKFSQDFESYLLKYIESSGFKQENGDGVNVGACGDSIDVCTNREQSVATSSSTAPPLMDLKLNTSEYSKTKTSLYPNSLFPTSKYSNTILNNSDTSTNTDPKDFEILQKAVIGDSNPGFQVIEGQPIFYSVPNVNAFDHRKLSSEEKGTMTYLEGEFEEAVGGNTTIDKLHLMFPKVSKVKLRELFGASVDDIDWAVGLLLDSGQEMVQKSETNRNSNQEINEMKPVKQEIKKKVSFSAVPDLSSPIPKAPLHYISEWDFKRELPSVLPKESPKIQRISIPQYLHVRGIDIATNTNYVDFEILRNINSSSSYNTMNVKVLSGNRFFISGLALPNMPTSSVLMLEKGTMTNDIQTNCQMESGIEKLCLMFPRVSRENLEELFEKCQKNIDWVAGLLLDSGQEMSELYSSFEPTEALEKKTTTSSDKEKKSVFVEEPTGSTDIKSKKKKKLRVSKSDNELYKEIQEGIQNNFVLDDSHYSSERMKNYFQRNNKTKTNNENDIGPIPPTDDNDDLSDDESDSEDDQVFMMDSDLILQLQARFGGLLRPNMIGKKTVIKLPLNLARQLHSYVMDSVHEHIEEDAFTDEDEEYARHLQEEEMRSQGTPSLLQIMDEEVALRKSQKDLGSGRSMASTLSKQLLIERFPTMDPSTLATILDDTNHSLHQATCLLSSAGYKSVEAESQRTEETVQNSMMDDKCTLSREEAIKQADAYGDVASQLYEMRKDCIRKSQKAYRDGNHSVALYYSDMARWYMERIEKSNSMAAKAILSGYEGWTTLDLHFLHISEALNVLNLFIDEVIRNLKDTNQRRAEVYIITGRGLHSSGGQAKLKPAVKSQLKKRDLKFCEQNPGMLRVFIPKNAVISYMTAVSTAV